MRGDLFECLETETKRLGLAMVLGFLFWFETRDTLVTKLGWGFIHSEGLRHINVVESFFRLTRSLEAWRTYLLYVLL